MEVGEEVYVVTNVELGWNCVCGVFWSLVSLVKYFYEEDTDDEIFERVLEGLDALESSIDECYVIHKVTY